MNTMQKIRLGASIVLLCALFLPLSQCSHQENAQTASCTTCPLTAKLFPRSNDQVSYVYAVGELEPGVRGAMTLLAFTWPLLFVLLGRKQPGERFAWAQYLCELFLGAGTLYWLHSLTLFGHWLYGAYVVVAATIVFGSSSLAYALQNARTLLKRKCG